MHVPDMSHASAITFDDTIVVVRDASQTIRDWYPLLFHEMVHVVQYSILGLDSFIARYLRAFAVAGMDYEQNEFEREAYALTRRFESAPETPFSVDAAVLGRRHGPQDQTDE
jgi:hypothetical protein